MLDIKFVDEGECLTSWAVSPDITLAFVSAEINVDSLSEQKFNELL